MHVCHAWSRVVCTRILPVPARVRVTGHVNAIPVISCLSLHVARFDTVSPIVVVITLILIKTWKDNFYVLLPDEPVLTIIISSLIKDLLIISNVMKTYFVKFLQKLPNSRDISSLYSVYTLVYRWLLGLASYCKFLFDFPDRMMLLMMRILQYHCSILVWLLWSEHWESRKKKVDVLVT